MPSFDDNQNLVLDPLNLIFKELKSYFEFAIKPCY
jgi:hypothetical protein